MNNYLQKTIRMGALAVALMLNVVLVKAQDYDFVSGNFSFAVNDFGTTCTLTGYYGSEEHVSVPSTVWGKIYNYYGDILQEATFSVTDIGDYAFKNCTEIKSISLPNSVKSIGHAAFDSCFSLTAVNIPNSVTAINYWTFRDCHSLASINIPNSVTYIANAFFYCKSLTSIAIPNSVTSIEGTVFWECSSLESVTLPNTITSIDTGMFHGCSSLRSINIPNSVTSIGSIAFYGCSSLTSINIPNSVTSIEKYTFGGCSSLVSIAIPDLVTSIEDYAFYGCSSLTSINIPNSVTSIGSLAFYGCSSLSSINIPNLVTDIGNHAFWGCTGLTSIIIPNSVTNIGDNAFGYCTGLTAIEIPNSVTSIGENAFVDCSGLKNVTVLWQIPLSVPNNVFDRVNVAECNLIVPMDTKSLYKATDVWKDFNIVAKSMGIIVDSDFDFASNGDGKTVMVIGYHGNGESMIIPSKLHDRFALKDYPVTSIGESAFANCNTIRSVTIPPSITSIGENAFESCLMLNTVTVQWETPLSVPNNIFSGVNVSECELVVPDGTASLYGVANVWKNFILPNFLIIPFSSLDFIAAGEKTTFNIVSNVKWVVSSSETWATVSPTLSYNNGTVTITASANTATTPRTATISVIGDQLPTQRITITQTAAAPPVSTTFDSGNFRFRINENGTSCTLIKYTGSQSDVVIPAAATYSGKSYSVTAIANAFELNLDLVSVTIPNSVTGIEASAFNNCRNLQDIVIPNSVTSIGERAFFNCNGLFSATLSNSLKSIGNSAFSACENLKAINIPNSVTSIGNSAFDHCASLPSVVIPSSVTAIGDGVFNMCRSLKSVTIPNTVTSIGERAFFYCFSLPSITIPNSVKIIGEEAFANCDLLTTVSIPASVTSLAASAFESCGGLTAINVASNNPNYTGEGGVLFNKNKTLLVKYPGGKSGEYTIPASVTAIGKDAFSSSYEITAVTIPATVTSIGETAFGYCTRLKKVTVQWQTPLSVPDDVFTYNNVAECDLVVPPGKENLYRAAPVWKDFRIATTSVLSLSPSSLSFPAAGGEKNISITANSPWTASSSASWLFSTPFGTSTGTVIVEAAANTTVTQRTASIVFSNGVITQTVSVAQAAAELPTENSQSIVITPDNVIINGEGGMNISLKIPTEGTFTISFIITLPQGFILDLSATALVSALSGRYDLNITPVASGKWRFDIIPKPLRSGMETNDLVRISCNVDNSVSSGSHNIVFNDINIILDSGQVIHQDEMNVPVKVTATSAELPTPSSVSFSSPFLKVFSPLAEQISIYSPAGALVFRADKPAGQSEYDLSNLPKGIMIARGSSGWARKIVVR